MYWETLPNWVWAIFHTFLLITLSLSIYSIRHSKIKSWSMITVAVIFTMLVVGFFNSVGREYDVNELEHLVIHLQQGSWWAIYIIICYVYIIAWWVLFFFKGQVMKRSSNV